MLHWWLLPLLAVIALALVIFYVVVRFTGGSGVRSDGRTLVDKPSDDDDVPGS
jgi:hypothetical protein